MSYRGSYILNAVGEPEPCEDLLTWARWMQTADRKVAEEFILGVRISTIFLGLDHNFSGGGQPVLWETMVFGGPLDQAQNRYTSKAWALRGHKRMVEAVTLELKKVAAN